MSGLESPVSETDDMENDCYLNFHSAGQLLPTKDEHVNYEDLHFVSDPFPNYEQSTISIDSREDDPKIATAVSDVSDSTQSTPSLSLSSGKLSPSVQSKLSDDCTSSNPEENIAYLKIYSLAGMLQLLENMNLGEHKKSFGEQQIDGKIFAYLDKYDLEDLGVTKSSHQEQLIKLIDGTVSAKEYEGDAYIMCAEI